MDFGEFLFGSDPTVDFTPRQYNLDPMAFSYGRGSPWQQEASAAMMQQLMSQMQGGGSEVANRQLEESKQRAQAGAQAMFTNQAGMSAGQAQRMAGRQSDAAQRQMMMQQNLMKAQQQMAAEEQMRQWLANMYQAQAQQEAMRAQQQMAQNQALAQRYGYNQGVESRANPMNIIPGAAQAAGQIMGYGML